MRKPNKTRGEVACTFNGHDLILCATMEALDQIDAELDLSIPEITIGLNTGKIRVITTCLKALAIEGDAEEALRTNIGVLGFFDLAGKIALSLAPDDDETDAVGKASATESDH